MERYFSNNFNINRRAPINNFRARGKTKFNIGYIVMIFIVIFLAVRAFNVINSYSERGALPYIQLLNFSMPVVETAVYDESVHYESKLTLKKVIAETLGLTKISTSSIIGNEISLFKNIGNPEVATKSKIPFLSRYEVSENSIAKVTEEELAQLNGVSEAFDPNLKAILEPLNLKVLIYHTHSHEGYAEIGADARWNTDNEDINVMGVGDVLAKELEEGYGITVIHDKTIHDNNYTVCYDRSQETLQSYLNEYGDFDLIIDLHRDSVEDKNLVTANINGQDLARIMFVTSVNSSRLQANTDLANSLAGITNSLFPGLMRNKDIFHYDIGGINGFNMSLSDNIVVWEVGANVNASIEAKRSAKYMARIIAEYFKE
ncbi:stage II sporulation protein P [Clostridium saudiense]|nr:stage II sporulation protein P [Clostridium saudiense]